MEKFRRYIYQNKSKIFKVIGIIAIVLIIIQILNWQAKQNSQKEKTANNTIDYGQDIAIITDDKKISDEYEEEKNIMSNFIEFCNEKKYEEAYNLLTDTCKNVMYQNVDIFKSNYCDLNFETKQTAAFQLWSGSTYMVEIREDIMSTGIYYKDYLQDYYTIVDNKLNIGGYIGRMQSNKEKTVNNITIKVKSIDFKMEDTTVNISVLNNSEKSIMLDTQESNQNTKLTDEKKVNYYSAISEKTEEELIVKSKEKKDISIKFYAAYRESLKFKVMTFKKIILDSEKYIQGKDSEYKLIEIDL